MADTPPVRLINRVITRVVADALAAGVEPAVIARELVGAIILLVDRRGAHAEVERAFDSFHESRPELEGSTEPFVRTHAVPGYENYIDTDDSDQPVADLGGFTIKNA